MKINGYKTYIVAIGLIMYALGGWAAGKVDPNTAIQSVFLALGMMGLRDGIAKKQVKDL